MDGGIGHFLARCAKDADAGDCRRPGHVLWTSGAGLGLTYFSVSSTADHLILV